MKALVIFIVTVLYFGTLSAQIQWYTNLESAENIAKKEGKLMVIDFWAPWCGPCKTLDLEVWMRPDVEKLTLDFIPVKLNVDNETGAASFYNVRGIPNIVVALFDGTVAWQMMGVGNPEEYVEVFHSIPKDVSGLYRSLNNYNDNKKDPEICLETALSFQQFGKNSKNSKLKTFFLNESEAYFKKAQKSGKNTPTAEKAEILSLLNELYLGNPDKAWKDFNKSFGSPDKCENRELAHFLLACCFKCLGNEERYRQELQTIKSENLLSRLAEISP